MTRAVPVFAYFYPWITTMPKLQQWFSTASLLRNSDPARWGLAWNALWSMTGPCHVAAVAVAPSVLVWLLVMAAWSLRSRVGGREFFAVAWLLAGSFAVFLVTPFSVEASGPDAKEMKHSVNRSWRLT